MDDTESTLNAELGGPPADPADVIARRKMRGVEEAPITSDTFINMRFIKIALLIAIVICVIYVNRDDLRCAIKYATDQITHRSHVYRMNARMCQYAQQCGCDSEYATGDEIAFILAQVIMLDLNTHIGTCFKPLSETIQVVDSRGNRVMRDIKLDDYTIT